MVGDQINSFLPKIHFPGGTVDITVHEIVGRHGLKEIASASGGNWGGTKVDAAFEDFIQDLVGTNVYTDFCRNHRDDFIELFRTFEIKKRSINANSEADVVFTLPLSLLEIYFDTNNQVLSDNIELEGVHMTKNKLRCKASTFKALFLETCDKVAKHIAKLLEDDCVKGISAIMMVGGFSESVILQDTVKKTFPSLRVIVPRDASLCVLKGAVMYGHHPDIISERVVRYTYGTDVYKKFEEGIDPISKRTLKERGIVCKDVFSKHVERNQVVKVGEAQQQKIYRPLKSSQRKMSFPIYASELRNPRYVTDPGCTRIGTVTVAMPDIIGGLSRDVFVLFTFSGTEINVTAKDTTSGNESNVFVDFLS